MCPDEFTPGTTSFTGVEPDATGKQHRITRMTCNRCSAILSEMHYGCCGHGACGFGSGLGLHKCEEKT